MASPAAIVTAAFLVVLFKFKSLVATVVVVAFVVAFDEPMKPFWFSPSDSSSFLLLNNCISFFATRGAAVEVQIQPPRCFFFNVEDGGACSIGSVLPMQWLMSTPFACVRH